jgi:hypothetical protein
VACARNSRSYRQYPQEQDQQGEFKIPLNHQAKIIFLLTILLPIACYFLARDCERWDLKAKPPFTFGALACDLSPGRQQTTAVSVFFAFVDFAHLARLSLDGDPEAMEPTEPENGKRFFPSGAIFFFALLILFYAALWLVVYWLMIARA